MKKKMTFNCYFDPGHGWLKTDKTLINLLGIKDKISTYSYMRKDNVYLEEDCDAGVLLNKLKELGIEYTLKHHYSNKSSKIRSYAYYVAA